MLHKRLLPAIVVALLLTVSVRAHEITYKGTVVAVEKTVVKVTVIDGRDANLSEDAVIQHHVAKVTQGGRVTFDYPHRIYRIYGRQMSIARPNDSVTQAVFFFANERLYMVESTRMRGGEDFDLIKFQQSLTFLDAAGKKVRYPTIYYNRLAPLKNAFGPQEPAR